MPHGLAWVSEIIIGRVYLFLLYLQILILKKGHVKVKAGVKPAAEWIPAGYCQWQDGYWVTFTKIFMSQRKLYHWSCGTDFECVCFPYLPQMQQITCPTLKCPVLSLQGYQPSANGDSWQTRRVDFFFDHINVRLRFKALHLNDGNDPNTSDLQ